VLFLSSKEKVLKEKNEEYEKLLKERKVGHDIHLKNKEQHWESYRGVKRTLIALRTEGTLALGITNNFRKRLGERTLSDEEFEAIGRLKERMVASW